MLTLINRLKAWRQRQVAWRVDHIAAFATASHRYPDGLTAFQHQCRAAIQALVPQESFERVSRQSGHGHGDYLVAHLQDSGIDVFIYENEAGFGGQNASKEWRIFEEWDFLTPKDLIECFLRELKHRVA